jgi:hypothetical protein
MSLSIAFTNLVFAVTVQSAPTVSGPWTHLSTSVNPCASTHHVSVNKTKPIEFFRFIPLDNGKAPTPAAPEFYSYGDSVRLVCPPIYQCPSSGIRSYRWFRDGVLVLVTTEPAASDVPPPGMHLYQIQIETDAGLSWLSNYSTVVF